MVAIDLIERMFVQGTKPWAQVPLVATFSSDNNTSDVVIYNEFCKCFENQIGQRAGGRTVDANNWEEGRAELRGRSERWKRLGDGGHATAVCL